MRPKILRTRVRKQPSKCTAVFHSVGSVGYITALLRAFCKRGPLQTFSSFCCFYELIYEFKFVLLFNYCVCSHLVNFIVQRDC